MPDSRELLGRVVRAAWVAWAKEQPDPKPSWLTGWDELDDGQREVDMRIGAAVAKHAAEQCADVAAERERARAALADALDGLQDMLPYVPEYFREKWEHQGFVDRAEAALRELGGITSEQDRQ
jgi:hypothetical protein